MSFSAVTKHMFRLVVGSIVACLFVVVMALPVSAMSTTVAKRTVAVTSQAPTAATGPLKTASQMHPLSYADKIGKQGVAYNNRNTPNNKCHPTKQNNYCHHHQNQNKNKNKCHPTKQNNYCHHRQQK
jgi:hypothetical protein